jgi:beta-glucanase (GH16 family)
LISKAWFSGVTVGAASLRSRWLPIMLCMIVWSTSAWGQAEQPYGKCRTGTALNPEVSRLKFNAESSDEFSGTRLDANRWHDINPGWVGRDTGIFDSSQVAVGNGHLALSASANRRKPESPAKVLTGTVVSKRTFQYGYFEARTLTASQAITSSFWFYREEPDHWTEIDVYENGGLDANRKEIRIGSHIFRLPGQNPTTHVASQEVIRVDYDLRKSWTVYGMYWNPDTIEFYVNGCLRHVKKNTNFHQSLNAVFDMEVMIEWMGEPVSSKLPTKYVIDYFRVWN